MFGGWVGGCLVGGWVFVWWVGGCLVGGCLFGGWVFGGWAWQWYMGVVGGERQLLNHGVKSLE